jgi:hypothetical protein
MFRIGAAVANNPAGPFGATGTNQGKLQHRPGRVQRQRRQHCTTGGIWGGQLQRWKTGSHTTDDGQPAKDQPALSAKVARVWATTWSALPKRRRTVLLDENGKPLLSGDNSRRFFEASWMHNTTAPLLFVLDRRYAFHRMRPASRRRTVHRERKELEPVLG